MDIVVDTSTVIKVIANEPKRTEILHLTEGMDLFSPQSLPWEIGNAFTAMFKRQRITREEAMTSLQT